MDSATCKWCSKTFLITENFKSKLAKIAFEVGEIPLPTLCPACRRLGRHAWQNERSLYRRTCSKTGKKIVSVYSPDKSFPVYHYEVWSADETDSSLFGRDYDFGRSFSAQFHELQRVVPRKSINLYNCEENCEFNNNLWSSKNTYLTFMSSESIDSYYNYASYAMRDCMDVWYSKDMELCYRVALGGTLNNCHFCARCDNSSDLLFCTRCRSCSSCFGCYGLRHKSYHIFNRPVSKGEYEKFVADLNLGSHEALMRTSADVRRFVAGLPREAIIIDDFSENCSGSFIDKSHNCEDCYTVARTRGYRCTSADSVDYAAFRCRGRGNRRKGPGEPSVPAGDGAQRRTA